MWRACEESWTAASAADLAPTVTAGGFGVVDEEYGGKAGMMPPCDVCISDFDGTVVNGRDAGCALSVDGSGLFDDENGVNGAAAGFKAGGIGPGKVENCCREELVKGLDIVPINEASFRVEIGGDEGFTDCPNGF
jgi:hypothetical protein